MSPAKRENEEEDEEDDGEKHTAARELQEHGRSLAQSGQREESRSWRQKGQTPIKPRLEMCLGHCEKPSSSMFCFSLQKLSRVVSSFSWCFEEVGENNKEESFL